MKLSKFAAIFCLAFASTAYATSGGTSGMTGTLSVGQAQQSQQQQSADAAATNAGNNQVITVEASQPLAKTTTEVTGTQTIKNTPSVSGPPLTTSNDTCMGSASGSANAPGIGISFGKTYTDANCVRLKNARELWNMGMKAASMALMCGDADNREALEITGYKCPERKKEK